MSAEPRDAIPNGISPEDDPRLLSAVQEYLTSLAKARSPESTHPRPSP